MALGEPCVKLIQHPHEGPDPQVENHCSRPSFVQINKRVGIPVFLRVSRVVLFIRGGNSCHGPLHNAEKGLQGLLKHPCAKSFFFNYFRPGCI